MLKLIITTISSQEEAEKIARILLEKKLVACVNIFPGVKSMYWWKGSIEKTQECLFIMKTLEPRVEELIRVIQEHHSYDCPSIEVISGEAGSLESLSWIKSVVGEE